MNVRALRAPLFGRFGGLRPRFFLGFQPFAHALGDALRRGQVVAGGILSGGRGGRAGGGGRRGRRFALRARRFGPRSGFVRAHEVGQPFDHGLRAPLRAGRPFRRGRAGRGSRFALVPALGARRFGFFRRLGRALVGDGARGRARAGSFLGEKIIGDFDMAEFDRELGGGQSARVAPADFGAGLDLALHGREVVLHHRLEHPFGFDRLRAERRGDGEHEQHGRRPEDGAPR